MKIKNKYILISGMIPISFLLYWFVSELILKGLSEKSDITMVLSVTAIGIIIVAIGFTIKFFTKKV